MSKPAPKPGDAQGSSFKMLRAMVGIGITSALLIVLAFELTRPRVQKLKAAALEQAILEVLPGTDSTHMLGVSASGELVDIKDAEQDQRILYAGYDETGELVGYAIEAAGQGYADVIRILYGYDPEQQEVIGFQVLESKETPGLGDKIEKEQQFLENFQALDLSVNSEGKLKNQVVTVKPGEKEKPWQVEGISGATISSRAVGDMIGRSATEVVPLLHNRYQQKRGSHE